MTGVQTCALPIFGVAVFLTTYHLLSGWASLLVRTKASQAVQKLLNLQPETAVTVINGKEIVKSIDELKAGDIVRVRPGGRIPIDGIVVKGSGTVDESIVTGESFPVEKSLKDEVVGGSVNQFGSMDIRVRRVGEDTFLQQVSKHVRTEERRVGKG